MFLPIPAGTLAIGMPKTGRPQARITSSGRKPCGSGPYAIGVAQADDREVSRPYVGDDVLQNPGPLQVVRLQVRREPRLDRLGQRRCLDSRLGNGGFSLGRVFTYRRRDIIGEEMRLALLG